MVSLLNHCKSNGFTHEGQNFMQFNPTFLRSAQNFGFLLYKSKDPDSKMKKPLTNQSRTNLVKRRLPIDFVLQIV